MLAEKLKNLRNSRKFTQQYVADYLGVTRQAYAKYENGHSQPDADSLAKLAKFYDVSIDYLVTGKEQTNLDSKLPSFSEKEEKDIAKKLESILNDLDSDSGLAFDGEPLDETTRELVKAQIESNLRLAKQLAKKKFTPKKYRDDSE
ncbi:helix-turn-helix domain-containing protein [Peribacillus asahii]|uniref:helix-turn-helix domain-containing protein n=1 Tax=Peribacillus asahii TaxID=228899 RepID=UPI00207A3A02|nr:helix-turn-helix domain-containing protein [Peribacillus asahii]USK61294.1 helix-turn-helix domain-containing protein [Peribacillus asahii]